jgi:hypothetical protein
LVLFFIFYLGGFKVQGGAGRVIINHAGSENGFVIGDGVEDIFISKKDSKDYHSSMNGEHYLDWFEKLLKAVKNKTVIVLDQAPYHRLRVPNSITPKIWWKKADIIANLQSRNIEIPPGRCFKRTLLELSDSQPVTVKYIVQDLAEKSGKEIKILWLPVAHCELNPIELIWSFVKRDIGKNNSKGGTKEVEKLAKQAISKVTPELWKNCVNHCIKIEQKMRERDNLVETNFIDTIDEPFDDNNEFVELCSDDENENC